MEINLSKIAFNASTLRKLAVAALLVISVHSGALALPTNPDGSGKQAAVTSMGVSEGHMLFNLKYDNVNQDKLNIVLADELGNVLYKEIVSTKTVNKTFKTSTDINSLYLVITNASSKKVQKFEITNEKRYVDELVITSVQ